MLADTTGRTGLTVNETAHGKEATGSHRESLTPQG